MDLHLIATLLSNLHQWYCPNKKNDTLYIILMLHSETNLIFLNTAVKKEAHNKRRDREEDGKVCRRRLHNKRTIRHSRSEKRVESTLQQGDEK